MEKLTAIYVEPMKAPRVIEIEDKLKAYQEAVGGDIEVVPATKDTALIVNEDYLSNGSRPNRLLYNGYEYITIYGPFLIIGDDGREFTSLTPEQAERYMKMFAPIHIRIRENI